MVDEPRLRSCTLTNSHKELSEELSVKSGRENDSMRQLI